MTFLPKNLSEVAVMSMRIPDRLFVQEVLLGRRRSISEVECAPIIKNIETEDIPVLKLAGGGFNN